LVSGIDLRGQQTEDLTLVHAHQRVQFLRRTRQLVRLRSLHQMTQDYASRILNSCTGQIKNDQLDWSHGFVAPPYLSSDEVRNDSCGSGTLSCVSSESTWQAEAGNIARTCCAPAKSRAC